MAKARQGEMFAKPKRPHIKRARVSDAGEGRAGYPYGASFRCKRCEWESGWLCFDKITDIRRGVPCPNCNPKGWKQ